MLSNVTFGLCAHYKLYQEYHPDSFKSFYQDCKKRQNQIKRLLLVSLQQIELILHHENLWSI